jgi:hypothetical protein
MVNDARRAAERVVANIRDDAGAHLHTVVLPALIELVEGGGSSSHPAVLATAVNDYCDGLDLAPAGKAMIRSGALAWIETQAEHDPNVVEEVASRIVTNALRSNTLAALQRSSPEARNKAVRDYVGAMRKARRDWDKTMRNDGKRFDALIDTLPAPPPSTAAIARIEGLFRERGLG